MDTVTAQSPDEGDYQFFSVEHDDDHVAVVYLDHPPVNAVTFEMYDELRSVFTHLPEAGDRVRAIVLAGRGRHFCAGNDLDYFEQMDEAGARELMFIARSAFHSLRNCSVPVIAAVHGVALGTGVVLASACDLVVSTPDARFGLPELQVGVAGGVKHLSRLVPQGLARQMFFTSDPITGEQMHRVGGVVQLAEHDKLIETAAGIAKRIARHSPAFLHATKEAINQIEYMELQRGYELEQGISVRMSSHPDSKEAVKAFKEGRTPTYSS
jgi:enoyl-CoA hydratase